MRNEHDSDYHDSNHLLYDSNDLLDSEKEGMTMKMSRHDRKMFNMGKESGYYEGYAKGLHDGNPFNAIAEALSEMSMRVSEALCNPEVVKAIAEMQETLEIEGEDDVE